MKFVSSSPHRQFINFMMMMMMVVMVMVMAKLPVVAAEEVVNVEGAEETKNPGSSAGQGYPLAVSELWELVKSKTGQATSTGSSPNSDVATRCPCESTQRTFESDQNNGPLKRSRLLEKLSRSEEKERRDQNLYSFLSDKERAFKILENNAKRNFGVFGGRQVLSYSYGDPDGIVESRGDENVAVTEVNKATSYRAKRVRDIDDDVRKLMQILEKRRRAMEVRKLLEQLQQWRINLKTK